MERLRDLGKKSVAISRLLGPASAWKFYLAKLLDKKQAATIRVQPKGLPFPVWIRPKGSDLDVALQIFLTRDYDLSWCSPYKKHISELCNQIREDGRTPLIIDAGANIGASTLWFALEFPDCQVFAVEPDQGNFAVLKKNLESCPNVKLFNAGLWDKSTTLAMTYENGTGWACRVEDAPGKVNVPSVTMPELLATDASLQPIIVKIDIEGAETDVFRSNTDWVDDIPLLIFEAHDNLWHWLGTWQGSSHSFFSTLTRRKREYLSRGENMFAFLHPGTAG